MLMYCEDFDFSNIWKNKGNNKMENELNKKPELNTISSLYDNDINNKSEKSESKDRSLNSNSTVSNTSFTRRQLLIFVFFGIVEALAGMVISLQAPFYPQEAERKGATATQYGFVFGIFEIIVFIMSPIYGRYMNVLGPKCVFNTGIFVTSICSILFGLLDMVNHSTWFIAISFIVRSIEACGASAFVTASFTIIALEFPNSVATTFASMETFYGLGLVIGPTVGGVLFQLGGFTLPFASIGIALLLVTTITALMIPKSFTVIQTEKEKEESRKFGFIQMISIPAVTLSAFTIMTSAISIGFNSAILEPHIRQFGLVPITTGVVLIISGAHYAVSAPLWGKLCDKTNCTMAISMIGIVLILSGYSLMGPLPIIPTHTILWVTCLGLAIQGLGLGATLVAAFLQALKFSLNRGFPDSIQTYGLVSGIWTSSFALGCFIGPSAAGILFDSVGYRMGTYFIIATQFTTGLLTVIFILIRNRSRLQHEF